MDLVEAGRAARSVIESSWVAERWAIGQGTPVDFTLGVIRLSMPFENRLRSTQAMGLRVTLGNLAADGYLYATSPERKAYRCTYTWPGPTVSDNAALGLLLRAQPDKSSILADAFTEQFWVDLVARDGTDPRWKVIREMGWPLDAGRSQLPFIHHGPESPFNCGAGAVRMVVNGRTDSDGSFMAEHHRRCLATPWARQEADRVRTNVVRGKARFAFAPGRGEPIGFMESSWRPAHTFGLFTLWCSILPPDWSLCVAHTGHDGVDTNVWWSSDFEKP